MTPVGVYPHRVSPLEERLWSHVDRSGGPDACWPWTGGTVGDGYGSLTIGRKVDGTRRSERAHRVAWTLTHGPIPDGLDALHHCDNPPCCNSVSDKHLFLGTPFDNSVDRMAKGRGAHGILMGSAKLDEESVRFIRANYVPRSPTSGGGALGRRFGVTSSTIRAIVVGRTWAHV